MNRFYKISILVLLTIFPIGVCLCELTTQNTPILLITSFSYILFVCIISTVKLKKYQKAIALKLGLFPVYQYISSRSSISDNNSQNRIQETIAFVGDSVTFGYDDDNDGKQLELSWPEEVSKLLGCTVINCGISSASLLPIDSWTPIAWAKEYNKIPLHASIVGFMIGINDCFRKYPLGNFSDKGYDTFYGGLHKLIKGLQKRYPVGEGKDIFMIIYPHYDADVSFRKYVEAMYKVADFYSVPVCDLSINLGVSPYNDPHYIYWRKYNSNAFHSPHPTQPTSHLIAFRIANYINAHYGIPKKLNY